MPWKGFNENPSSFHEIPEKAFEISSQFHPAWFNLKDSVKRLHARNAQQILGPNLDNPSLFVVCWTNPAKGGTNQALRIATYYEIPIYNYWIDDSYRIEEILKDLSI